MQERGVMISPKIPHTGHVLSTNVLNYTKTKMFQEYNTQYNTQYQVYRSGINNSF
jgi:hypothetical protein